MDYSELLNKQVNKEAVPAWTKKIVSSARDKIHTTSIKSVAAVKAAQDGGNAIAGLGTGIAAAASAAAVSGSVASGGLLVLPILGFASLAYSTYSNRESLHKKLSEKLHDPFDGKKNCTVDTGDKELVKLAFGLIGNGISQIQQMDSKYKKVKEPYEQWKKKLDSEVSKQSAALVSKDNRKWLIADHQIKNLIYEKNDPWLKYVRRIRHISNYQQAGLIIGKYCENKTSESTSHSASHIEDIWQNDPIKSRAFFEQLRELHKRYHRLEQL